jgi:hypothetical protein
MGNVLGLMMGSRARTFKGRLFGWAVGLIAPLILKKVVSPDRMENIVHELSLSWERVRERIRKGRDQ